jgi:FAD/FMN-containing dehydrogenase
VSQCYSLSLALPNAYFAGTEASLPLWSIFQATARPLCRVEPEDSKDVAEVLQIIRRYECHFSILGGGTSPFRGASNADQGITIDMRRMKDIEFVNKTKGELKVGAGSLWADVYRALEPFKMAATGTRNSEYKYGVGEVIGI